jgi:hypothetical protein
MTGKPHLGGVIGPANVHPAFRQVHHAVATVPEVDDQPG